MPIYHLPSDTNWNKEAKRETRIKSRILKRIKVNGNVEQLFMRKKNHRIYDVMQMWYVICDVIFSLFYLFCDNKDWLLLFYATFYHPHHLYDNHKCFIININIIISMRKYQIDQWSLMESPQPEHSPYTYKRILRHSNKKRSQLSKIIVTKLLFMNGKKKEFYQIIHETMWKLSL